jgi:hypothetical protein
MRGIILVAVALLVTSVCLRAAEVQIGSSKPKVSPSKAKRTGSSPQPSASPAKQSPLPQASPAAELPKYRPALLGTGPNALINRIDTEDLIKKGQKDASIMFYCFVAKGGEITLVRTYRGTPGSKLLEAELTRRLDQTQFIPAVYNREPVAVIFYGTVTFAIVDGKPRLRIFANQEAEEIKKESDFIGPQPFVGRESKFEGLHYPGDITRVALPALVELAMKVDADGNLKELNVVSAEPVLLGFGEAAAEDFRVAKFIPAFRAGKPVECSITLPVYYEPEPD